MSRVPIDVCNDLWRQVRLLRRHLRHGRASWGTRPDAARDAGLATVFRGVNAYLRELGVDYALAYGTLLGWQREGRLMAHDKDVDFMAPVSAYPLIRAQRHRLPPGFRMYETTYRHFGPKLYVACRDWEADIYFCEERDDTLRSLERCKNPGDVAPFPREFFYPLQPAVLLGEPTRVPAQPVALLTLHYGYLGADAVRDPVTRYFRPRGAT